MKHRVLLVMRRGESLVSESFESPLSSEEIDAVLSDLLNELIDSGTSIDALTWVNIPADREAMEQYKVRKAPKS